MYQPGSYGNPQAFAKFRELQVDSVLRRFPNARSVAYDNSIIDVSLVLKNNSQITFRVQLPPAFPQIPPLINLQARSKEHPNLDPNYSIVLHSKLSNQNWPGVHASLGDIIANDIFPLFLKNPPQITSYAPPTIPPNVFNPNNAAPVPVQTTPAVQPAPTVTTGSTFVGSGLPLPVVPGAGGTMTPNPATATSQQISTQIPKIPTQFNELSTLKDEELQNLIDESAKFDDYFEKLEYVKNIKKVEKDLRDANLDIASKNMQKHEELSKLAQELADKQNQYNKLHQQYQDKVKKQQDIARRYQPQALLHLLNEKIKESEEETENMGESFLQRENMSEPEIKAFIQQFMEKRSIYYLRKNKKERFQKAYCQ